jgi:hypothetical protein
MWAARSGRFFQLSDVHMDVLYSAAMNRSTLCRQSGPTGTPRRHTHRATHALRVQACGLLTTPHATHNARACAHRGGSRLCIACTRGSGGQELSLRPVRLRQSRRAGQERVHSPPTHTDHCRHRFSSPCAWGVPAYCMVSPSQTERHVRGGQQARLHSDVCHASRRVHVWL